MAKPQYLTTGNDANLARLIKDGAVFIREAGTSDIPEDENWTPTDAATQIGFYSDDGFQVAPSPGDTTEHTGHNGDVLIAESDPGYWTIQFASLEGNKVSTETYFDTEVDPLDGSITVTSAAANKRYDIVTVGLDQQERPILVHYPNVQISEREGITFNRTTLLAMSATFRTFRGGAAAPYHMKAWGLVASDSEEEG